MELGRDVLELAKRAVTAFERTAIANEKLIELATEERNVTEEAGPSFCPHCQTFNPSIFTEASGGDGPMHEFVLVARCSNCQNVFYGLPEGWEIAATLEDAKALRKARAGGNSVNSA